MYQSPLRSCSLHFSWQDGSQFAKLINILRPGYITPDVCTIRVFHSHLQPAPFNTILNGLNLAEDEFGVPQVIDAEDMCTNADERSNFVYLSYYKQMVCCPRASVVTVPNFVQF